MGPPVLVGATYFLSFSAPDRANALMAARVTEAEARAAQNGARDLESLTQSCAQVAEDLLPNLPKSSRALIRPPFVLAGDLSENDLDGLYRQTVLPVTRALWRSFYDRKPNEPVVIVALAGEASYHSAAATLDGYEPLDYSGYTRRGERRIVLNLATGRGTLAHELAHVLASFDFPNMPEWFDEGLAALHEDATFSSDGLTMIGTSNWRSKILHAAARRRAQPTLESVIRSHAFRGEGEGLNYAVVRGFCQYLQERGLLSHFYRKFRGSVAADPVGISSLCELLDVSTIDEVDRDFQAWVLRSDER